MTDFRFTEFGRKVQSIREEHGLSLRAMASRIGVSFNTLSRVERGQTNIGISALAKVADWCELSIDEYVDKKS